MRKRIFLQIAFLFLIGLPACAQITLTSPQEFQVFQRHTKAEGKLSISGHIATPADRIEARISGTSIRGQLPDRWIRLTFQKKSGDFHATISLFAGGYYSVEVRALRIHDITATASIQHVGIGEVFVISGQSNATNWGEQQQSPQTGMVTSFDGTAWRPSYDPQPGTQDNSVRGSFIPPFGDELYRKYKVPIGIVSVGRGATSVRQWLPAGATVDVLPVTSKFITSDPKRGLIADGTLFNVMNERIRQLGPHGFRMLLWDQGQSDSSLAPEHTISGDRFREMTTLVIRTSRRDVGWNFPWMSALGTYMSPEHPADPAIQTAQRALWKKGLALEGPDTDILTGAYREKNGMGVHYNATGLKTVAAAWAKQVEAYIDVQP